MTADVFEDRWPQIFKEFDKLNRMYVAIGYFGESNESQLLTIVRSNEYGAFIHPKNGEWLTIPTKDTPVGPDGGPMPARQIPGLFRPKGKNILAVSKGGDLTVMYTLVKEVRIPARPFIRTALIKNTDKYRSMILSRIGLIIDGNSTARILLNQLGAVAVSDIRREMIGWSTPGNAPATIERKGTNNPLVDKGILSRAVTYKVIEGSWHD